jgi:hypothetical protein
MLVVVPGSLPCPARIRGGQLYVSGCDIRASEIVQSGLVLLSATTEERAELERAGYHLPERA